jgi:hypothetical protein
LIFSDSLPRLIELVTENQLPDILHPTSFTRDAELKHEELGLKLEPAKGPREYFVIDHIERPAEN